MELIIGIVVGIIIGLVVGTLIVRRRYIPVGDLRIDRSDPTSEPFLFLELGTDVRTISGMKTVTLTPTVLRLSSLWAQTNRFVLRTLNPV